MNKIFAAMAMIVFGISSACHADVVINELLVNPGGADNGNEFVELSGDMALTDLWFVVIEGDSSGAGTVDQAIDLSSFSLGSNGLFLIRDDASIPVIDPNTNDTIFNFSPDIENGTNTFALVFDFTGSVGTDLDTNNDGTLDSMPWSSVSDALAWTDGGASDHMYGAAMGGIDVDTGFFTPDTGFRDSANGTWFFADVTSENLAGQWEFDQGEFTTASGSDVSGLPWDFENTSSGGANPQFIPEPSSTALLAIFGFAALVRRRRKA